MFVLMSYQDDGQENKQELQRRGAVIPEHNYLVNHRFIGCSLMFRGDVMPARINSAMKVNVYLSQLGV